MTLRGWLGLPEIFFFLAAYPRAAPEWSGDSMTKSVLLASFLAMASLLAISGSAAAEETIPPPRSITVCTNPWDCRVIWTYSGGQGDVCVGFCPPP